MWQPSSADVVHVLPSQTTQQKWPWSVFLPKLEVTGRFRTRDKSGEAGGYWGRKCLSAGRVPAQDSLAPGGHGGPDEAGGPCVKVTVRPDLRSRCCQRLNDSANHVE